jgi:hypothetical protein
LTDADGDDVVEPLVLLARRFVSRGRAEVPCLEVQYAAVVRVDERAVVGLDGGAHVNLADAVGPDEKPVPASRQNLAGDLRAEHLAAFHINDVARALGRRADLLAGIEFGLGDRDQFGVERGRIFRARGDSRDSCGGEAGARGQKVAARLDEFLPVHGCFSSASFF